jgi:hypothetical protein
MTDQNEVLLAAKRTLELNLDSLDSLYSAAEAVSELMPIIQHQLAVTEATIDVIDEALSSEPEIEAPTGLTASTNLASRIEVRWDTVAGADSYILVVDGVAQEPTVANMVNFGRLDYGQEVDFQVAAQVGGVAGNLSDTVVGAAAARPALPDGFRVSEVTDRSVLVEWDTVPPENPGTQVHRTENGGLTWISLTKDALGLSFLDERVLPGVDYTYRIRGYNAFPEPKASRWSSELTIRTADNSNPEPVEPSDFVALDAVGNTVEQNKVLRIPDVRASRAAREQIERVGDVTRNDWKMGDGDLLKENLESVVPQGYSQWSSNLHKRVEVRPGDYTWKNIGVSPGPGASQLKWGTREYNAPFRQFLQCDFTAIPREHGLYVSNYEGTEVRDCTFLRCGSQGVQFAHRPLPYQQYDADNLVYAEPPVHIVANSHFVDNAYKGDRPSFNLTYFNPGTSENPGTIVVEDSTFVCNWDEPKFYGGKELRSTGAMVVGNMQGNKPLTNHPMMEAVTLRNSLFDYTRTDRSVLSLRSIENLLIEDCAFILRDCVQPLMTVDKYIDSTDVKTKTITVRNTHAEGGLARIELATGGYKMHDIHCPGEQIVIDGVTGEMISRTAI